MLEPNGLPGPQYRVCLLPPHLLLCCYFASRLGPPPPPLDRCTQKGPVFVLPACCSADVPFAWHRGTEWGSRSRATSRLNAWPAQLASERLHCGGICSFFLGRGIVGMPGFKQQCYVCVCVLFLILMDSSIEKWKRGKHVHFTLCHLFPAASFAFLPEKMQTRQQDQAKVKYLRWRVLFLFFHEKNRSLKFLLITVHFNLAINVLAFLPVI